MCSKELLYPIPIPPVSVFLLSDKAILVHPTFTSLDDWKHSKKEAIVRMIGDRPVEHMDGVIDERTRVRQILSFISTVILSDETQKFAVKECVYNVILGLSFQEPVPSNFSKWIREAGADVIPKYRGWNTFISERGPYVFEIVTHTNPRLHSFPSNDKQLKESVIRSTQAATEYVYEQVS